MTITAHYLGTGFGPHAFMEMVASDPARKSGRYHDLYDGPDLGHVMASVGWSFAKSPVAIGLFDSEHLNGGLVAIGFAAPIWMNGNTSRPDFHGINLSYGVHSAHEGRRLGLAASCLALQVANSTWENISPHAHLNIQTRQSNTRGNSLARALGAELSEIASFSVEVDDGPALAYAGYRTPWAQALEMAGDRFSQIDFIDNLPTDTLADDQHLKP